jgi:hypothetical protein
MILFVGDKPSRANKDPLQAFKGTKSDVALNLWIDRMGLDIQDCMKINQSDEFSVECARSMHKGHCPIITLGVAADKAMIKANIPHFCLPHPSGCNRVTNGKRQINALLHRCCWYIFQYTQADL